MIKTAALLTAVLLSRATLAADGDVQVKTDHPWYPGELSCSTFERQFKTEAALYKRVTGRDVNTDEDKAIAAWYWRNIMVSHSTDAACDYWGKGFDKADVNREYWTGLFGFGYSLCFTTHAQWCGEMEYLLGHNRARTCNVPGHTSFEVFLTGGEYKEGRWVLLDHDVSTIMYNEEGTRLVSIAEIVANYKNFSNPDYKPERQHGWRAGGLHDKDPQSYDQFKSCAYEAGYAGPPPMTHLRAGESIRRYIQPGLGEKTYIFWGLNFMTGGIAGPERSRSWVNQPEKMYKAKKNCGYLPGMARYGNAVFTYKPDFASSAYKEGVVSEDDKQVTFEHNSPYIIGCTPAVFAAMKMDCLEPGSKNGLVIKGKMACAVKVSLDHGKNWKDAGTASDGMDLTDIVKGYYQYWLRFEAPAKDLAASGLTIITGCQSGQTIIPRLKDGKNAVTFLLGGTAVASAGPTVPQAQPHVVDGAFNSPTVTLELAAPRGEKAIAVYANGHVASSSPPKAEIAYQIDYSTDGGKTWQPVVKDWKITRRGAEPDDFWSQSMCYGNIKLPEPIAGPVRVRFSNSGGKPYLRAEAHLVYNVSNPAPVDVTFGWKEVGAPEVKTATHTYAGKIGEEDSTWSLETGTGVETIWVDYAVK